MAPHFLSKSILRLAGVALLVAAVAGASAAPNPISGAKKDEGFQVSAPHAILIDAESGSILFEKNADDLVFPASLAKLMTAEVVFNELRQGNIKRDQEFLISENAWRKGGAPSHTSSMFAAINSRVSVGDLLKGAVIQSGNDACIALAEGVSGNENAFAEKMTARARELGLTKSVFTNATGLPDPGLKVTTRELAKLAQHIIRTYPEFYPIYGETEFTWNKIRQVNRNPLLVTGADGLKTGYTKDAGYGIVGSAVQNGLRLIVVITGAKTAKDRADDARKLIEWGFRNFEARVLFAEGQPVGEAKVFGGQKGYVPLMGPGAIRLMVPRGVNEKIIARVVYTGPVPAPVERGRRIATLKVWRNDNVSLEVPLSAAEPVAKGNISQRAFDAVTELVIGLFRAGAERL
jgi:D-alanyl-D-alanine carboxypeptidase (penicillin-binding protein 5/6)